MFCNDQGQTVNSTPGGPWCASVRSSRNHQFVRTSLAHLPRGAIRPSANKNERKKEKKRVGVWMNNEMELLKEKKKGPCSLTEYALSIYRSISMSVTRNCKPIPKKEKGKPNTQLWSQWDVNAWQGRSKICCSLLLFFTLLCRTGVLYCTGRRVSRLS